MKTVIIILALSCSFIAAFGQSVFQKDFAFYWQTVDENFAYFDKQHIDWGLAKTIYQPEADTVTSRASLISLLERMNNELHNGHVFLNTNLSSSNRLIPSGADMKVALKDSRFTVTEIREGYNADLCGLKTGMVIEKYNGVAIKDAIKRLLPRSAKKITVEMYEYAANMLLAGTHDTKREITILVDGKEKVFTPDELSNKTEQNYSTLLESRRLVGNIGYIRINNSLGNSDMIKAFDSVLDNLDNTDGIVIDLRETPGGGTTIVARAIMGRFIDKEMPYQKHIYTPEEKETGIRRSTLELVSPRKKIYKKPVVILVGYWTSSMGEGIAIGFDGMKRADIVGTKMAGLLGEIYTFETPETKIPFSFPCVQLQHVNGQPREDFVPAVIIKDNKEAINTAVDQLHEKIKKTSANSKASSVKH